MTRRIALAAAVLLTSALLAWGATGTASAGSSFKNVQAPTMSQCQTKLAAVTTDLRRAGYTVTRSLCQWFGYEARGSVWYSW